MAGYDLSKILNSQDYSKMLSLYGNRSYNSNKYVDEWSPSTPTSYTDYNTSKIESYTNSLSDYGVEAEAPTYNNQNSPSRSLWDRLFSVMDIPFAAFNVGAAMIDNAQSNEHYKKVDEHLQNLNLPGYIGETALGIGEMAGAGIKNIGNTVLAPFSQKARDAVISPGTLVTNARDGKYGDIPTDLVEGVDKVNSYFIGDLLTHTVLKGGDNDEIGKIVTDVAPYFLSGDLGKGITNSGSAVSALVKNKSAKELLGGLTKADALKVAAEGTDELNAAYKLKALAKDTSDLKKLQNGLLESSEIEKYAQRLGVTADKITPEILTSSIAERSKQLDELFKSDLAKDGEALWTKTNKALGTYSGLDEGVGYLGMEVLSPELLEKLGSNNASRFATIGALSLLDPFAGVQGLGAAGKVLGSQTNIGKSIGDTVDTYFKSQEKGTASMAIRNGGLSPIEKLRVVDNIDKSKWNKNFQMQLQDKTIKEVQDIKSMSLKNDAELSKITDILETPHQLVKDEKGTPIKDLTGNDKYEFTPEYIEKAMNFSKEEIAQYREKLTELDRKLSMNTGVDISPQTVLATKLQAHTYKQALDSIEFVQKVKDFDIKSELVKQNIPNAIANALDGSKLSSLNRMSFEDTVNQVKKVMPDITSEKAEEYANTILSIRDESNRFFIDNRKLSSAEKIILGSNYTPHKPVTTYPKYKDGDILREKYDGTQTIDPKQVTDFINISKKFMNQISFGSFGSVNGRNLKKISNMFKNIPEGFNKEVEEIAETLKKSGFDLNNLSKEQTSYMIFSTRKTVNAVENNIKRVGLYIDKNVVKSTSDTSILSQKNILRDFLNTTDESKKIIEAKLEGEEREVLLKKLDNAILKAEKRIDVLSQTSLRFPKNNYRDPITDKKAKIFETLFPETPNARKELTEMQKAKKAEFIENNPSDIADQAIEPEKYISNMANIIDKMETKTSKFPDFKVPDIEGKQVNSKELTSKLSSKFEKILDKVDKEQLPKINEEIDLVLKESEEFLNEIQDDDVWSLLAIVHPEAINLRKVLSDEMKNEAYSLFGALPKETLDKMPENYTRLSETVKILDSRKSIVEKIKDLEIREKDMDEIAQKYADYAKVDLNDNRTIQKIYDYVTEDRVKELNTAEKYIYDAMKEDFDTIVSNEALERFKEDYIPHLVSEEFKKDKRALTNYGQIKNKIKAKTNKFDQERTLKGTIEEINAKMEEEFGYKNFLESDPIKLWSARSIASNSLMYQRNERNNFVKRFGVKHLSESAFLDLSIDDIKNLSEEYGFTRGDKLSVSHKIMKEAEETGNPLDKLARADKAYDKVMNKKISQLDAEKMMYYEGYKTFIKSKVDTGKFVERVAETYPKAEYITTSINRGALQDILKAKGIENIGEEYAGNVLFKEHAPSDFIKLSELPQEIQDAIDLPTYAELTKNKNLVNELTENVDYVTNKNLKRENKNPTKDTSTYLIHENLAQRYDEFSKKSFEFDNNLFGKGLLYYTKLFQASAIASGSFHVRNIIGNTFNSWMEIGKEVVNPKKVKIAQDILRGKNGSLKGINYKDIMNQAQLQGVLSTSFHTDNISKIDTIANMTAENMDRVMKTGKEVSPFDKLSSYNPLDADNFLLYKANRKVGGVIEENAKMVNFITHLQEGKSFREAGDLTNKVLFDYSDLSYFEKNFMKRIIPFYTFMRKNIPLQAWGVANAPASASISTKIYDSASKRESETDKKLKPSYLGMSLPVGNSNYANLSLPLQSLTDLADPKDMLNNLHPLMKLLMPSEQTKSSSSKAETFGEQANSIAESLLPSWKTANNVSKAFDGDEKAKEALYRKLGVLNTKVDMDKAKDYALSDYSKQLQNQLKQVKQENGDKDSSYNNASALLKVKSSLRQKVSEYLSLTGKDFNELTPMEKIHLGL